MRLRFLGHLLMYVEMSCVSSLCFKCVGLAFLKHDLRHSGALSRFLFCRHFRTKQPLSHDQLLLIDSCARCVCSTSDNNVLNHNIAYTPTVSSRIFATHTTLYQHHPSMAVTVLQLSFNNVKTHTRAPPPFRRPNNKFPAQHTHNNNRTRLSTNTDFFITKTY